MNSIKGVRRVDGLLHLMGFHNAKSIHSQMQQRHRLNSMEYFAKSTDGVLIATDVAARGLDISDIKNVFHYDIARSPQVYVHRSGRTARGLNGSGVTVSLVSPVDHQHYADICRELKVSQLPSFFTPNGTIVTKEANTPDTVYHDMEILAEAVKLAKEIYKINFINAQESMESNWMKRMSDETDILMDDATLGEQIVGNEKKYSEDMEKAKKDSKVVHEKKMQLQSLVRTKFRKPNARPLSSNPVANNALIQTKSANKSGFSRRNENKKMSKHKLEKQQVLAGRSWKKDRLSVIVAR